MRAIFQWLALAPLLVFSGCRTLHSPTPPADSPAALSKAECNLAEALAHYSQALISETTLGEAQYSLNHFRQAAVHDPSYLPLSLKVAVDYISRRDYTGAVTVLNQAARYHPDSAEIQLVLGSLYQTQGKIRDAIRAFRSAIRLAPERADGYVRLATLHAVSLDRRSTLAVIDAGLPRVKDQAPLLDFCENVGRIYLVGKDAGGAALFFERIRRYKPGREDIRELLGRCYVLQGRNHEAIAEYETLLKSHADSSQLLLRLGELYEEEGDTSRARAAFKKAMEGAPPEPMAFIRLAGLQLPADDEQAIKTLIEATARFPDDVRVRAVLALIYMRTERHENAIKQFEQVEGIIAKDDEAARLVHPMFYFWYGGACDRAGRSADAERFMAKYLALNPGSAEALNTMAYLWAEQGRNLDQAMDYITKALVKEPSNGAYLDTLGWIHYKKGNYPLALKHLTLALKKEGDDPAILEHIGDTHLAMKQKSKALRMWWKSIRMGPDNKGLREKMIREGVDAGALPPMKRK
jgi:tetratricopeptide (TPR) repeat protein